MRCAHLIKHGGFFFGCLAVFGCSADPPVVYIPGKDLREALQISTGGGTSPVIGVNEPLTLHARRTSGPWVEIRREELQDQPCWQGSIPAEVESEVADNVKWLVRPDSSVAAFNVQYRPDHTREVRFFKPGVYALTAHSNMSCTEAAEVDTLNIKVVPRPGND